MTSNMISNILNKLYNISGMKWHQFLYTYGVIISSVFFIISLFGISFINFINFKYISTLRIILKIYLSLILLIRFNPYINRKKTKIQQEFDRNIAFSAGFILLFTTTLLNSVEYYIKSLNLNEFSNMFNF